MNEKQPPWIQLFPEDDFADFIFEEKRVRTKLTFSSSEDELKLAAQRQVKSMSSEVKAPPPNLTDAQLQAEQKGNVTIRS